MHVYTFIEAKQNLSSVCEQAIAEGGVQISGENGQVFMLMPISEKKSPLDVESVDLGLTTEEIVNFVHEGRKHL